VNVPFIANIDPDLADTTAAQREQLLKERDVFTICPPTKLKAMYEQVGVTPDREVITYCGRGFAAAGGLLALKVLGHKRVRLYDGSWAEWSNDPRLPIETGFGAGV
jgi:thiosulfate/3-mercaptopyruvate sulfurtransferase